MSQKPSLPQGTRDFLPEVALRRAYIFDTIRGVFQKYGYQPIETPALEQLSVLTGKYGEEGDRLIFKVLNSGDFLKDASALSDYRALTPQIAEKALRYDLTVPFARFVVMHQNELVFPFKRYQIQPVWRADRPQRGRYREFYQCDADVVGSNSLLFEAEFIAIYDEALSKLGLKDFSVRISNRKILSGYAELAGQPERFMDICTAIDKLDKIGRDGVAAEMAERGIGAEAAQKILNIIAFEGSNEAKIEFLEKQFAGSESGQKGLAELREVLELYRHLPRFNAKLDFDLTLARGLNYYTGAIYEVVTHEVKMGSIGGGGRYDDLTGVFGKPGLSGVGISFGADRIYDVLNELNLFEAVQGAGVRVLVLQMADALPAALAAVSRLRGAGINAELYPDLVKLGKQFQYAERRGIPYAMIIGPDEAAAGSCQLKNLATGEQERLSLEAAIERVG